MMNGASIKDGAPGIVSKALRIDTDGPYVIFPNLDISPSKMPEMSMIIEFYLESIPEGSKGWLLNHDNGGYDRALVLHDERFNGISHGVGYPAGPVYDTYTQPEVGRWIQMVVTYRQGGECAVFLSNDKAPITHEGRNNEGKSSLTLGRVTAYKNHWCDCWIKGVTVYDKGLSDEEVDAIFGKFKDDIIVPSGEASDDDASVDESVDEGESAGEPDDSVDTDYTTKACTIGEAWSPHRAMINHKNFNQDQWDNGLNMDCAGWKHHTRFWAFPTKQPGTIRFVVGEAWNPHRICINHECQTQEQYNNGASMNVAGWKHHSDFWAYPTKQPDTIRIAVGTASNPHRHHLNHAGQSQDEYNNGASMSVYGWTQHCDFWAYPSDQTHQHDPEPVPLPDKPLPKPIISIKAGDEFFYEPWGGRCVASYINGTLIMNRVGSSSKGIKTWMCKNADETKKLLCGLTVGVEWDNRGKYLKMTAKNNDVLRVMHGSKAYFFKRMMPLPAGSAFNYGPWGGKCVVSYGPTGKMYLGRPHVARTAKAYCMSMRNAFETDKLRAGHAVNVNWDNRNKYNVRMTMTNPRTLSILHYNKNTYKFTKM